MPLLASALLLSSIRAMAVLNPMVVAAAPAGGDAAAYAVIYNMSGTDDRLVSVSCDCAERVEIRQRMETVSSLALPAERLVEIQPGGTRHLMLINLRRSLLAGQTVSLHFRFEHGGDDTRDVPVAADARAAWAAALVDETRSGLTAMTFFAGSCWRGTGPEGGRTDTHCFSPVYGGMFLQDRHSSGETIYHYDVMGQSIHFAGHASDGSRSAGVAIPTSTGLVFPAETRPAPDGGEMTVRSSWTRDGPDSYVVLSEARQGHHRRELSRMRMVRIGPTPPR